MIRKVPPSVDRALKKRAKELGMSLNSMILSLLKKEACEYNISYVQQVNLDQRTFDHDWEQL